MEDFLKRLGYSIARGVPQAATGFVDLAALPFTMSGMIKPEDVFLSTDYLTQKGFLPKPEQGLLNQTTELLSSAISPAAATKAGILATGGLLADAARVSGADLTPVGAITVPKGLLSDENSLNELALEARKAPSFEEFKKDFLQEIKHGKYYHVTDNPNFSIDKLKGSRDMSSMGGGSFEPNTLMMTSDLENWTDFYGKDRPFVVELDVSGVPREDYEQVNRGFGNEFFVKNADNVKIKNILPVDEAIKRDNVYRNALESQFKSDADLKRFYENANQPKGLMAEEPGITAYHGSPYDFDKFSLDKVDSGEGAQAFGYGLYFTDSEDIAKFYKDKLSDEMTSDVRYSFKGEEYERGTPEWKMLSTIYNRGTANAKKLVKELKSDLAKGEPYITADQVNRYEAILNQAPKKSQIKENFGRTYEVDIAPKVSELIDYDKPLGEQNQFVKDALKKVADEMNINDARNLGFDDFDFGGSEQKAIDAAKKVMLDKDQSVVAFLNNWSVFRGTQGAGEELLKKHGIRGIKYKANQGVGARNVPEQGANNYVIFDDKDVNIKRKYELGGAGLAGLLGYQLLDDEDEISLGQIRI